MNFQGTIIKTSEIIGIGPLMNEESKNRIAVMAYGAYRLYYEVITRTCKVRIESNFFTNEIPGMYIIRWKTEYVRVYEEVCRLLGEDLPFELLNLMAELKEKKPVAKDPPPSKPNE